VTGSLSGYTRDEIKEMIISYGGKVTGSVSNNTNFLLAGENPGSKFMKAQALGVAVITETEFLHMIGLN